MSRYQTLYKMKFQTVFITSLGSYTTELVDISQEEYEQSVDALCTLAKDGNYMHLFTENGEEFILSKEILRSCIIQIKRVDRWK